MGEAYARPAGTGEGYVTSAVAGITPPSAVTNGCTVPYKTRSEAYVTVDAGTVIGVSAVPAGWYAG